MNDNNKPRGFFQNLLNRLWILRGINQLKNIRDDCDSQEAYINQVNELVTELCDACREYPFIPNSEKKKIITQSVERDPNFYGLNKGKIIQWLEAKKNIYFREKHHMPAQVLTEKDYTPVTGEKRDAYIQQLIEQTKQVGQNFTAPKLIPREIEEEGQVEPKKPEYKKLPDEVIRLKVAIHKSAGKFYWDKVADYSTFQNFTVENQEVFASNLDDARQIYIDAMASLEKKKTGSP